MTVPISELIQQSVWSRFVGVWGRPRHAGTFPGLQAVAINPDGTHKLSLSADWRNPNHDFTPLWQLFNDFEVVLDAQHHTAPIVLAANSPSESRLVIDIISAFKLYRTVADAHSGSPEHVQIMLRAKLIFGKMRLQIQGGGSVLLLDWHGSRVLKRIILFSRASEILNDCQWLFVDQRTIHAHIGHLHQDHREPVHSKCAAAVLHATINQLVRFKDELQLRHLVLLDGLLQHFHSHPCTRCFPEFARQHVKDMVALCQVTPVGSSAVLAGTRPLALLPPPAAVAAPLPQQASVLPLLRAAPLTPAVDPAASAAALIDQISEDLQPSVMAYATAIQRVSSSREVQADIVHAVGETLLQQALASPMSLGQSRSSSFQERSSLPMQSMQQSLSADSLAGPMRGHKPAFAAQSQQSSSLGSRFAPGGAAAVVSPSMPLLESLSLFSRPENPGMAAHQIMRRATSALAAATDMPQGLAVQGFGAPGPSDQSSSLQQRLWPGSSLPEWF